MDHADTQNVAFVAYGNAFLQGKKVVFAKNNPAAKYYRNISFRKGFSFDPILAPEKMLAKNPNDWFRYLKEEGFERLYLVRLPISGLAIPQKIKEALSNLYEKAWFILAQRKRKYTFWHSQWEAVAGDLQIYYYPIITDSQIDVTDLPVLKKAKDDFTAVLTELVAFTKENKLSNWEQVFQKALDYFTITDQSAILLEDLLPDNCFTLEAYQLFAACDQAWVFGGMGSWNDVTQVSDYEKYKQLTTRLITAIYNSLAAIANSYPIE
jgi:hypothetical protein